MSKNIIMTCDRCGCEWNSLFAQCAGESIAAIEMVAPPPDTFKAAVVYDLCRDCTKLLIKNIVKKF